MGVLDLFSGCGGLSLGFALEGFDILGAVELDPVAAATHYRNFTREGRRWRGPVDGRLHALDIRRVCKEPETLRRVLGVWSPGVLVGGPPCQAYARIGRAKLREVARGRCDQGADDAHIHDARAHLYQDYLHLVGMLMPRVILVENVPDALNHGGRDIGREICGQLDSLGYVPRYTLLNAVRFGVPQFRERMFILAFREDLRLPPDEAWWPEPVTVWPDEPRGYGQARSFALKAVRAHGSQFFDWHPVGPSGGSDLFTGRGPQLPTAPTARQAIGDLPAIVTEHSRPGRRPLLPTANDGCYRQGGRSGYAALMRNLSLLHWAAPRAPARVSAHVTRHLERDFDTFRHMPEGADYSVVKAIAREIGAVPPPYDDGKFVNKWWKLHSRRPVKTLTAHMGKDTYSHIHYREPRTISVREAARLQSFPDQFLFEGNMNAGFRMIGNSVPPLLARALAGKIREVLEDNGLAG